MLKSRTDHMTGRAGLSGEIRRPPHATLVMRRRSRWLSIPMNRIPTQATALGPTCSRAPAVPGLAPIRYSWWPAIVPLGIPDFRSSFAYSGVPARVLPANRGWSSPWRKPVGPRLRIFGVFVGESAIVPAHDLRETKRRNTDGSSVDLALAQNERDPVTGVPRARNIHRFGHADQADREALARLVRSISRFLTPSRRSRRQPRARGRCLTRARWAPSGWRTGCGSVSGSARRSSRRPMAVVEAQAVERAIFAMVANRLSVRPLSKLAGCGWVAEAGIIEGLAKVSDDRAIGRWTSCTRRLRRCRSGCSSPSRTCLTSRSTCCSLTPPRPTGDRPAARRAARSRRRQ